MNGCPEGLHFPCHDNFIFFGSAERKEMSDSELSDDSFVSSDDEPVQGPQYLSDEDRPANAQRVRNAYHSKVEMPDSHPDGLVGGRRFLRKNETAYANRPANDYILPGYAQSNSWLDSSDRFGLLVDDTREVVGTFNDENGNPIARIVESKPPPPDKNYAHMQKGLAYKLNRAQGIDPDARAKSEVEHIANPEDNVYGEATIVEARIKEATAVQARNVFFNRTHAQSFADQELARDDIYDGYNIRAPHKARTPALEHSWRHVLDAPTAPKLPEGLTARRAVHGKARAERCENAAPYSRQPHAHQTFEQIDTKTIPLHSPCDTDRGHEDTHERGRRVGSGAVTGAKAVPRARERPDRKPELGAVALGGTGGVAQVRVHEIVTISDNDREQNQPTKSMQPTVDGSRVQSEACTREGGDVNDVGTTPRMRAEAAPVVTSTTYRTTRNNIQRAGGDDQTVQRLKEHDGTPHVSARRALPFQGARDLSEDDIRMTELLYAEPGVLSAKLDGIHTADGTDATDVKNKDVRLGTQQTADKIRSAEDATLPERATLSQPDQLRLATSSVPTRRVVAIGEDRIPTLEAATWHGDLSFGAAQASVRSRRVDENMDQLNTTRNNESHPGAVIAPASDTSMPTHRSCTTTRAQSGKGFLPDRLEQPNQVERTKIEQRVEAQQQLCADRATPISALYGTTAEHNQRASIGEYEASGRETPLRWEAATTGFLA